ncbi:hypothetical protein NicSoilC12_03680 [Arthrobacter sp. NicSoilC12]|nr:hypothetical protein NicSoilC12_03680 [Arthrobacter sp. NicSoilC12]
MTASAAMQATVASTNKAAVALPGDHRACGSGVARSVLRSGVSGALAGRTCVSATCVSRAGISWAGISRARVFWASVS